MVLIKVGKDLLKGDVREERPGGRGRMLFEIGRLLRTLWVTPLYARLSHTERPRSPASVCLWEPPNLARPSWIWQTHVPLAAEIHKLSGAPHGSGHLPRTHPSPACWAALLVVKLPGRARRKRMLWLRGPAS